MYVDVCFTDVNECNDDTQVCGQFSQCTNSLCAHRCDCLPGYEKHVSPSGVGSVGTLMKCEGMIQSFTSPMQ